MPLQAQRREKLRQIWKQPTQAAIDLELTRVADLTGRGLLRRTGSGPGDLFDKSYALCQGFGLRA